MLEVDFNLNLVNHCLMAEIDWVKPVETFCMRSGYTSFIIVLLEAIKDFLVL